MEKVEWQQNRRSGRVEIEYDMIGNKYNEKEEIKVVEGEFRGKKYKYIDHINKEGRDKEESTYSNKEHRVEDVTKIVQSNSIDNNRGGKIDLEVDIELGNPRTERNDYIINRVEGWERSISLEDKSVLGEDRETTLGTTTVIEACEDEHFSHKQNGELNNKISGEGNIVRQQIDNYSIGSNSTGSQIRKLFWEDRSQSNHSIGEKDGVIQEKFNIEVARKKTLKRKFWQLWRKKDRDRVRNINRKKDNILNKAGIVEKSKKLVFHFTTEGLTTAELEILGKGETFCVTNHKVDTDTLKTDIFKYNRRLRLHEEFRETKKEEGEHIQGDARESRFSTITRSTVTQTLTPEIRRERRGRSTHNRSATTFTTPRANRNMSAITNTQSNTSQITNRTSTLNSRSDSNINIGQGHRPSKNYSQEREELYRYNPKDKGRKLPCTYDPVCQNRNLNRYISCIQEECLLVTKNKTKFRDNITKEQRGAIKTLTTKIENKEIILSKADKGSGLVAVDYETYIQKGTKYIEEEAQAYTKLDIEPKSIIRDLVKARDNIVQKLKQYKIIEVETATYCTKQLEEKITGIKFYYKVHKDTNIQTMPLRPLQSCINVPTHHPSQVLTDLLQPYLKIEYIPTYIQDSNQLLYRLNKLPKITLDETLISSDVAALYPSIPHEEGLVAVEDFLSNNSIYNNEQIQSIIRALKLVITENFITWNNNIYKQTSGVAMGTPVAVAYANIFMNWVDEEIRVKAPFVIEHIRYIDDNLFIVPRDKIEELMDIANNILKPNIKFTYEKLDREADTGLPFLDTQLFISEDGIIESRLYTKKTDKHAYLLPSSYHPIHITRNIPLAVFTRIRRICSRQEWFQADAMRALEWLEDRGYKYKDIKRAIETSGKEDRWKLITNIEEKRGEDMSKQNKDNIYEIPFIVTYSHKTKPIKRVLKQRQGLLDVCFRDTKVRPRLTLRRQQNINDSLIQKSLRGPIDKEEGKEFTKCGVAPKYRTVCPCKCSHDQKICRCCAHAKLKVDNIKVKLHKKIDCETKNVIYMIGCNLCSKKYVGETQQKLKERLLQHLNNISKLKQPLYTHFNDIHKASNLYITILETVRSEEQVFRKVREAWWINKLQTLEPRGFNVKLECSQVYTANFTTVDIERRRER